MLATDQRVIAFASPNLVRRMCMISMWNRMKLVGDCNQRRLIVESWLDLIVDVHEPKADSYICEFSIACIIWFMNFVKLTLFVWSEVMGQVLVLRILCHNILDQQKNVRWCEVSSHMRLHLRTYQFWIACTVSHAWCIVDPLITYWCLAQDYPWSVSVGK